MLLSTARLVSSSVLAGGTLVGNLTLTGDLTVQGNTSAVVDITTTGDVTLGDTTADTITINGTATLGEVVSINRTSNDLLLQTTTSGNIVLSPAGSCFVQLGTVSSGVWQGTAVDGTYVDIEGTEIKSAGETGRIKFLMEDGDGTCSWQPVTGLVTSVSGSTGAVTDGDIDHDSLLNFASNEHFTQANITATGTVASGTWSSTISSATLGATLSCADVTIERPEFKDYGETLTTANTSTSYTIDLTNGNVFELTLTGNCTYTFSNPPGSGIGGSFTLIQKQDGSGSRTVSWPASVDWAGGSGPTISSGANDVDVFTFVTTDAGTTWYGFTAGQDFS